ncbi:uncharacterized protein LOC131161599 [Malania oleifera]|uniref:uncharacterized protein LOC131161599 n=1 Tax=Malania oleifera TaxID=397392 RepID=UPI0025AE00F5|nr:uncharacterized protein LOC131161599 [Malania oleifera]XP_057973446.1 uncharacterized protein LOC131161599 [Malania oleifera]XP_057973447.1 uncharacterized protein LOC131161599 [Malania oleifera]
MRGIGGPLLSIGDLLNDVGDGSQETPLLSSPSSPQSSPSILNSSHSARKLDLIQLFQENYDRLNEALAGTDHSWTALTLKLCTALETASRLVQSSNSNATSLLEKVEELEGIIKTGDSAVAAAKAIHASLNWKDGRMADNRSTEQSKLH